MPPSNKRFHNERRYEEVISRISENASGCIVYVMLADSNQEDKNFNMNLEKKNFAFNVEF